MVMTALVHFGPKEAGQAKFEHILLNAVVVQQMVDLPFSRLNEQFKDTQVPGYTYETGATMPTFDLATCLAVLGFVKTCAESKIDVFCGFDLFGRTAVNKVSPSATPIGERSLTALSCVVTIADQPLALSRRLTSDLRALLGDTFIHANHDSEARERKADRALERALGVFGQDNLERLRQIKKARDPEGVFRTWF